MYKTYVNIETNEEIEAVQWKHDKDIDGVLIQITPSGIVGVIQNTKGLEYAKDDDYIIMLKDGEQFVIKKEDFDSKYLSKQ